MDDTNTPDAQQLADEDLAAELRDHGHSWAFVADTLNVTTTTAKHFAAAADTRAAARAARHQIALF